MSSPAELLLGEMRTKLDGQLATLESARTRAAVVLSVSGVIAGLFAQHLTKPIGNWGLAALAAFVVSGLPVVWILGPHKMTLSPEANDWIRFATEHYEFVKGNVGHPDADPTASSDLGASQLAVIMLPSMQEWYDKNNPLLTWVHRCLVVSSVGVLIQLICWGGATVR